MGCGVVWLMVEHDRPRRHQMTTRKFPISSGACIFVSRYTTTLPIESRQHARARAPRERTRCWCSPEFCTWNPSSLYYRSSQTVQPGSCAGKDLGFLPRMPKQSRILLESVELCRGALKHALLPHASMDVPTLLKPRSISPYPRVSNNRITTFLIHPPLPTFSTVY
jgi:hypothetical protein